MDTYPKIVLKPGKEESLLRFHPWVFSGAIAYGVRTSRSASPHGVRTSRSASPHGVRTSRSASSHGVRTSRSASPHGVRTSRSASHPTEHRPFVIEEGDKALVVAADGRVLGVGHTQVGSIAVRMLTFKEEPVDEDFYANRLERALQVRQSLNLLRPPQGARTSRSATPAEGAPTPNNTFRLVHGEGDFLPGLIIDIYDETAVMQAHSVGMHLDRELIAGALKKVCGGFIKQIYYKSEGTLPYKAGLNAEDGYLWRTEKMENSPIAIENGLKFYPDWEEGQKTGFFIDQRENRALVERYAKGRRVLNMFCYTGGFSLYALRGGAELVHSVDSSAKAIELVNLNFALNFGEVDGEGDADREVRTPCGARSFCLRASHKAFVADAFEFFDGAKIKDADREVRTPYDLIILDPPAFAKHQKVLHQALQGYRKLNAQAFKHIAPGGILFTFSCSQAVSKDDFRRAVFTAAAQSGRKVRILHQLTQPADHPVNIYHPEGEYLKGLVLYVE